MSKKKERCSPNMDNKLQSKTLPVVSPVLCFSVKQLQTCDVEENMEMATEIKLLLLIEMF